MSYYLSPNKLLSNLKRAAKDEKRATGMGTLTQHQNNIAKAIGFQSWSLLHNRITKDGFQHLQERRENLARAIHRALPVTAGDYAARDVEAFFRANFERCSEYSVPSAESPNGYSHPSVAIEAVVHSEFGNIYQDDLLALAISRIDSLGPWCEDDLEVDFDEPGHFASD